MLPKHIRLRNWEFMLTDQFILDLVYKLITKKKSWSNAEEQCKSLGGHLATIRSAEENNKIVEMMNNAYVKLFLQFLSLKQTRSISANQKPTEFIHTLRIQ